MFLITFRHKEGEKAVVGLVLSGMAKTTGATLSGDKFIHLCELRLHDWYQHELGNALTNRDMKLTIAAIPAGYIQRALIV